MQAAAVNWRIVWEQRSSQTTAPCKGAARCKRDVHVERRKRRQQIAASCNRANFPWGGLLCVKEQEQSDEDEERFHTRGSKILARLRAGR